MGGAGVLVLAIMNGNDDLRVNTALGLAPLPANGLCADDVDRARERLLSVAFGERGELIEKLPAKGAARRDIGGVDFERTGTREGLPGLLERLLRFDLGDIGVFSSPCSWMSELTLLPEVVNILRLATGILSSLSNSGVASVSGFCRNVRTSGVGWREGAMAAR